MKRHLARKVTSLDRIRPRSVVLRHLTSGPLPLRDEDDSHDNSHEIDSYRLVHRRSTNSLLSHDGISRQNSPLARSFPQSPTLKAPTQQLLQQRHMSSWFSASEVLQDFSIWGATGVVIKSLHNDLGFPYWSCFATMNFMARTALLPLVVYGAHTAARYAKVAPEIQFIITLFQNDLKKMRAENKSLLEQRNLFLQNLQTVSSIYKLHKINPLSVFLSPFLQIPIFYYVATDLRKIVNGSDPSLAQELTESNFLWHITDLTDPDPWFFLPVAAGAMLYFNVEVAIGKRSLTGPATHKSDFAGLLKDGFQTLAVFMPCFSAVSPAGLQIYLVSSFSWTLVQSAALRTDICRAFLGLPPLGEPPTEPKFAKEFMEFKKLEQKAKELRGDGPVLGKNVLAVGFETSFAGTNRASTIEGSSSQILEQLKEQQAQEAKLRAAQQSQLPKVTMEQASAAWGGNYVHGISAPMTELEGRLMESFKQERAKQVAAAAVSSHESMPDEDQNSQMEAANLGVKLGPASDNANKAFSGPLDAAKFKKRKASRSKSKGRKR